MKRHVFTLSVSLPDSLSPEPYLNAIKSVILIGAKRLNLSHTWTGETRHVFTIHTTFLPLHFKAMSDAAQPLIHAGEILCLTREQCVIKSAEAARYLIETVYSAQQHDKSDEAEMERFYLSKVMSEVNKVSPPV